MYQYGPFQSQEAREIRMTGNIASSMEEFEIGLLVCGLAHLHSMCGKLQASEFEVIAYTRL